MSRTGGQARTDWEDRIGLRSGDAARGRAPRLDPPEWIQADGGRGQVTLDWAPVTGAIGYQVYGADDGAELAPVDHGGGDVLGVPHPPYVDTTGTPGNKRRYAVAALSDVAVEGPVSDEAIATPFADGDAVVNVLVDAGKLIGELARPWRPMIGSEHLSHAVSSETTGGRIIGEELSSALRAAHLELGVQSVRAHGIL